MNELSARMFRSGPCCLCRLYDLREATFGRYRPSHLCCQGNWGTPAIIPLIMRSVRKAGADRPPVIARRLFGNDYGYGASYLPFGLDR